MPITTITAIATWAIITLTGRTGLRIFLQLPATLAHELAHWSVALLTGSSPDFPSIIPRREANGWVLGQVVFTPKTLTAGAVALAPLWCLSPMACVLYSIAYEGILTQSIQGVAVAYLVNAAIPSSQDWLIAVRYPIGALLSLLTLYLFIRYWFGL